MNIIFVARILDVRYAPLLGANASVAFDGGQPLPLLPTASPGVLELPIPAGASTLDVTIEAKGFWPIKQRLTLVAGALPTLAFGGVQEVGARNLEAHSRGADVNVLCNFVLGQLKDARAEVDAIVAANGAAIPYFAPKDHLIRELGGSLLQAGSRGWDRLAHVVSSGAPSGRLLLAQRQTTPKLVAFYVPDRTFFTFQRESRDPVGNAVPYHVFFTPSTAHMSRTYPFHLDYVDLIARYLLFDQVFDVGKAMTNQQHVSKKRAVFVFPIASPLERFAAMPTQSNLLRILEESSYWLQRMLGVAFPLSPVGKCAVSAFSSGADSIEQMLDAPFGSFDHDHLREIYAFDLFKADPNPLITKLRSWFRSGKDGRKLRVYTQDHRWRAGMLDLAGATTLPPGPSNAFEQDSPSSTLLYAPASTFWRDMKSEVVPVASRGRFDDVPDTYDRVHQFIPALFMEHALSRSTFADA